MTIQHITIIGLGLLGSSIARATAEFLPDIHIHVYDTQADSVAYALENQFADTGYDGLEKSVLQSDMVILATPLSSFAEIAQRIMPVLKQGAILTDTGSVKGSVIDAVTPFLRDDIYFIPAHPIAGTEQSGVRAGFSQLFQGKRLIYTPLMDYPQIIIDDFTDYWQALGAIVETMDVVHHDQVFAVVSHIPHLIAYNIVGTAAHLEHISQQEVIRYAASGFRDFTRLASSDPKIWRDVFLHNKDSVLEMLARFTEDLITLQKAIRYEQGDVLQDFFTQARTIRQQLVEAGVETGHVNFGRDK